MPNQKGPTHIVEKKKDSVYKSMDWAEGFDILSIVCVVLAEIENYPAKPCAISIKT